MTNIGKAQLPLNNLTNLDSSNPIEVLEQDKYSNSQSFFNLVFNAEDKEKGTDVESSSITTDMNTAEGVSTSFLLEGIENVVRNGNEQGGSYDFIQLNSSIVELAVSEFTMHRTIESEESKIEQDASYEFLVIVPLTALSQDQLSQLHNYKLSELNMEASEDIKNSKWDRVITVNSTVQENVKNIPQEIRYNKAKISSSNSHILLLQSAQGNVARKPGVNTIDRLAFHQLPAPTHDILERKYTVLGNEDGTTIWIRDYKTSQDIQASELKSLLTKVLKEPLVKRVFFNGKQIYNSKRS
jgi:hypothetical protein